MGFSNNPQRNRILVTLSKGKFNVSNGKDQGYTPYDCFEGILSGIRYRDREDMKFADLEFADGDQIYAISVIRDGTLFTGIVRTLIGVKDFSQPIRMESWVTRRGEGTAAREYTNVSISQNGERLRWNDGDGCPGVEIKDFEGQKVTITGPRDKWVTAQVEAINRKLHPNQGAAPAASAQASAGAPAYEPAGGYGPGPEEQYYDPNDLNDLS